MKSRLTLISVCGRRDGYNKVGLYRCECGAEKEIRISHVKSGRTISCGCFALEYRRNKKMSEDNKRALSKRNRTHGLRNHPLYDVYSGIKKRCNNPNCRAYPLYGGRGVKICDEWNNSFLSFYNWCISNGWERGLEIDKDIKGGLLYSPETCLIVTRKTNSNNTSKCVFITIDGVEKTVSEWCRHFNSSTRLAYSRIKYKSHSGIDIFTKPSRSKRICL